MKKQKSGHRWKFFGLLIIAALVLGIGANSSLLKASAQASAAKDQFTVVAYKLPVKVIKANGSEVAMQLDAPVTLEAGDTIAVSKGGRAELYYGYNLSVEAWQGAEMVVKGVSGKQINLLLLVGQIHATVPANSKFKVAFTTTYQVLTSVVADTEFIICHDPNTKKLTCNDVRRGEVEVEAHGVVSSLKGRYGAYTREGEAMSPVICEHVDETDKWVIQTRNGADIPPLGALVARWYNEPCPGVSQLSVIAEKLPASIIKSNGTEIVLKEKEATSIEPGDKVSVGSGGLAQIFTAPPAAAAQPVSGDLAAKIQSAKILVYEDTAGIGLWIKDTLDKMGLTYTHDGDAQGRFMNHLNEGTKWDLIIVAGESRAGVQGEFWEAISKQVNDNKTALIAEMWYLDSTYNGKIKPLLDQCGIAYQSNVDLAPSLYLLDINHPVSTTPNNQFSLYNYSRYWTSQSGDLIKLAGGDAKLLLGTDANNKASDGISATCLGGRAVFQTISNHDYHKEDVMALWENYISWVLSNRFK